jgi:hypothetical protein
MTKQQYQELLELKEERISHWEQYGIVPDKDEMISDDAYPEARI